MDEIEKEEQELRELEEQESELNGDEVDDFAENEAEDESQDSSVSEASAEESVEEQPEDEEEKGLQAEENNLAAQLRRERNVKLSHCSSIDGTISLLL